ncbi:MAG TPA: hypothetical protein VN948_13635 [Terriglobales bacterium]|nr:hypothetical protein [Terriglobales bacterium]
MRFLVVLVGALVFPLVCLAGDLTIIPTTTLSQQTSNNTSAANGFGTQSNGNPGATNVSKLDTRSLLYPGSTTKIFAHLVLWFGRSDHMNVGYSSTDPLHVKQQITDMISRGIDGVVMVWYGPNNSIDKAAQLVMKEAELHPGFTFAIMIDHGAIEWDSCSGCDPQEALIEQLQYIEQTYFPSPAYLRIDGQPAVTNFDIDLFYNIDWNAVKGALQITPAFIFQNSGGFSHVVSNGAYSWVMPTGTDYGMSYLTNFYSTGAQFPSEATWGAGYKGFNDTLASWGMNRIMGQQCGQTWLQTFSEINRLYDSTNQLSAMQLVTWNDYEEGTEIESGIDNCMSVLATLSGSSLQWSVNGDESTVDDYTVYVSADGQNLMQLAEQADGARSLDMCSYALPSGNYTLYVQAVGKASLKNEISGPVPYTAQCGGTPPPPPPPAATMSLTASPSSVTLVRGQAVSSSIIVTPQFGPFNTSVSLSCANLPTGLSCAFWPAVVTPGAGAASSVLTISTTAVSASLNRPHLKQGKPPFYPYMFSFALVGFVVVGAVERKRAVRALVLSFVIGGVLLFSSCGVSRSAPSQVVSSAEIARGTYTILIKGVSGTTKASTSAVVTIR